MIADLSGGLFAAGISLFLIIAAVALATSVFWIVELIDVARREFPDPTMKVVWLLVIFFGHIVGSLIYYFAGKPMGTLPGEVPRGMY